MDAYTHTLIRHLICVPLIMMAFIFLCIAAVHICCSTISWCCEGKLNVDTTSNTRYGVEPSETSHAINVREAELTELHIPTRTVELELRQNKDGAIEV